MPTVNNNVCIAHIIVIFGVIIVNSCKCTLLYSPLNSYLYLRWTLDFKYIVLLLILYVKSLIFLIHASIKQGIISD